MPKPVGRRNVVTPPRTTQPVSPPKRLTQAEISDRFTVTAPAPVSLGGGSNDFDLYAAMVRKAGGQVNPNGQPTVLALRTQTDRSTRYRDTIVVLTADRQARVFTGSTVPSFKNSSDAPDINKDGIYDVGVIMPGNYNVGPHKDFMGYTSFEVNGAGRVPGWRDTDGDGVFSDGEKSASNARNDNLSGVLFHRGMSDRPMSVGCITMDPTTFDQFIATVGGKSAKFNFTLVDVAA
jgi:hypothetical protein